jgi:hypothetical protein
MLIHFPTALCTVAPLTAVLHIILGTETLERFTLYCVALAALATPPSIASGLVSWRYNYGAAWTPLFRAKIRYSLVLAALLAVAAVVRLALVEGPDLTPVAFWVYMGVVLSLGPTVVWLGYLGGKITFPS